MKAEKWLKINRPWDGITPVPISLYEVVEMLDEYAKHAAQERFDKAVEYIAEMEYEWRDLKLESPANVLKEALRIAAGLTKPQQA